jgi:hypothetical protein
MIPKEMLIYQDKLYYVYRKIKSSQVKDGYVNVLKDFWHCDIVVKNRNQQQDENLLFLREIEEATIVS